MLKFVKPAPKKFKSAKKKHVETMFNSKDKAYTFYYKSKSFIWKASNYKINPKSSILNLVTSTGGWVGKDSLKAVIRIIKWFLKTQKLVNKVSYKLNCFPDFVLTSRAKETRMGKGKGSNLTKVAKVKKHTSLLEIYSKSGVVSWDLIRLSKLCKFKLPLKIKEVRSSW
jgi:ribosomal protein L16/L10AE